MATAGKSVNRNHQTQWAAQFAVASELCKRDYEVSFTLGHSAPIADIIAISPKNRTTIYIDVKGLYRKNPWLIKRKAQRKNLFYILAYVPRDAQNEFFILSQATANRYIASELKRLKRPEFYKVTGFIWSMAQIHGDAWDLLPR